MNEKKNDMSVQYREKNSKKTRKKVVHWWHHRFNLCTRLRLGNDCNDIRILLGTRYDVNAYQIVSACFITELFSYWLSQLKCAKKVYVVFDKHNKKPHVGTNSFDWFFFSGKTRLPFSFRRLYNRQNLHSGKP